MKPLKENFLVKTSYAYITLIFALCPVLFLVYLVHFFITISAFTSSGKTVMIFLDFFHLFGMEKLKTEIAGQSWEFMFIILVFNLAVIVGLYLGVIKLRSFFKNVLEEKPFAEENGKHLKSIGLITIIVTAVVAIGRVFLINSVALELIGMFEQVLLSISSLLSIVFSPFFILGIFIYVFGEIIIRAANIKEENDLTV